MANSTKINKAVFIDTNIFIKCAAVEIEQHNISVLEKIYNELDDNKFILLMPDVIYAEIRCGITEKFRSYMDSVEKEIFATFGNYHIINEAGKEKNKGKEYKTLFVSSLKKDAERLASKAIKDAKSQIVKRIEDGESEAKDWIDKIIGHANTKHITGDDSIIIRGIRRSALKQRPASVNTINDKPKYLKDIDCIAWESIIQYLVNLGKSVISDVVVCTDDGDYFDNVKKDELHNQVTESLTKLKVNSRAFRSPLVMIEKEFKTRVNKDQHKSYNNIFTMSDIAHITQNMPTSVSMSNIVSVSPVTLESVKFGTKVRMINDHFDGYVFSSQPECPACSGALVDALVYVGISTKHIRMCGVCNRKYETI